MASVRKRFDREGHVIGWQAVVRRKGSPQQIHTFRKKFDAEAWAREVESEIERGVFVSREEAESTILAEALARYARTYAPRLKSAREVQRQCAAVARRPIGRMSLARIHGADIADYRDARSAEGAGANAVRLEMALLSRLFNVAAAEWGMESLRNPCRAVPAPGLPRGRDRRLVGDEEARLLAACRQSSNPWLAPAVDLAIETAMRHGELLALRWEHVSLSKREAYLPETKNGTSRTVPLSLHAVEALQKLPRALDGRVLATTESALRQAWRRARKRAGITGLTFHDLRHEATSRLAAGDLSILELSGITGHKTLQMLKRYYNPKTEELTAKLDRLNHQP